MKGPQPAASTNPPPTALSNAGPVANGLRKPQEYIKHSLSGHCHHHQHLGSQEAPGTGTLCKGPCCCGLGTTWGFACTCIRESCMTPWWPIRAVTCVTEPVSDAILCLLQEQDGPHRESSALAAAAVTGLDGQQHCRAGLPSKQLQSQGELRQDQGKSSLLSWICDVLHSSFQATIFGIQ